MTKLKHIDPSAAAEAYWKELRTNLGNAIAAKEIGLPELLAIHSKFVGILIAMQDQTANTQEALMESIIANMEMGNQEFIDGTFANLAKIDPSNAN